jgi:hypothetical protein
MVLLLLHRPNNTTFHPLSVPSLQVLGPLCGFHLKCDKTIRGTIGRAKQGQPSYAYEASVTETKIFEIYVVYNNHRVRPSRRVSVKRGLS